MSCRHANQALQAAAVGVFPGFEGGSAQTTQSRTLVGVLLSCRNYYLSGVRVGAQPDMFSSDNFFFAIAMRQFIFRGKDMSSQAAKRPHHVGDYEYSMPMTVPRFHGPALPSSRLGLRPGPKAIGGQAQPSWG